MPLSREELEQKLSAVDRIIQQAEESKPQLIDYVEFHDASNRTEKKLDKAEIQVIMNTSPVVTITEFMHFILFRFI